MFEESIPFTLVNPVAVDLVADHWLPVGNIDTEWTTTSIAGSAVAAVNMVQFRLMTEADNDLLEFRVADYARSSSADTRLSFFIAPDPGFGGGYHSSYTDEPPPGEEGEIVVIGKRPKAPVDDDNPNPNPGDPGTPGGGGETGGGGGGNPPDAENNDCSDRKAISAAGDIDAGDQDNKEMGVIIYRDSDGNVQKSGRIDGNSTGISLAQIQAEMTRLGIGRSQILGFVHNHPTWAYGGNDEAAAVNQYPSNNDWGVADWFVAGGAGGAGGSDFALYVIDTDGKLREFSYQDKSTYTSLSNPEKERDEDLPDELEDPGGSC